MIFTTLLLDILKQFILLLLSFLFGLISKTRIAYYSFFKKSSSLNLKVISIGNIRVGGMGKTPLVVRVCNELIKKNYKPIILTRGYMGGIHRSGCLVVLDQKIIFLKNTDCLANPDEAMLQSYLLPSVPIVCGRDRLSNIHLFLKGKSSYTHVVLDDGFQHLKIKRDLDLVLVDDKKNFGFNGYLPYGRFRESEKALERADVVLLSRRNNRGFAKKNSMKNYCKNRVFLNLNSSFPIHFRTKKKLPLENPVVLIVGIAQPKYFLDAMKKYSLNIKDIIIFQDHQIFTLPEIDFDILTTSKDYFRNKNLFGNIKKDIFICDVEIQFENDKLFEKLPSL